MKKSNLLLAALLSTSTALTALSQDAFSPDTLDINLSKPKHLSIEGTLGRNMGLSVVAPAQIGNYPCEMHAGVTTNRPNSSLFGNTEGNLIYFRTGVRSEKIPLPHVEKMTGYAGLDAYMGSNTKKAFISVHGGLQAIVHQFGKNSLSVFGELHHMIGQPAGSGVNFGFRVKAGLKQ